ncbi:ABC transporter integral membrane type 1 [Penicillium solitum]|uniref:ABC transporter integral membrane type 1 n=1 Tax=Penicillium solitum TaxID=60172 RepID=UPI0032C41507|nr:ABC transporter integral membrane type 1 [Penicillium solitum]
MSSCVVPPLISTSKIWSPVITFIVYAVQAQIRGDDSLTTVKAFTALSIITPSPRPRKDYSPSYPR